MQKSPQHFFPWHLVVLGVLAIGITVLVIRNARSGVSQQPPYVVAPSTFEEWIPLSGRLEAGNPVTYRSELNGLSKLTFLEEDGTPVSKGDVIARFDDADLEERRRTLVRDRDIAQAALTSLLQAEHPLELQRIQQEILAVQGQIQQESLLQAETQSLVKEDLLAPEEAEIHAQNLASLQARKDALEHQLDLTRRILHPAAAQTAKARLAAAEGGLRKVEEDLAATVITASRDGTLHLPRIPIDSERRPAHVGDGLYRNQVYLQLSDLTNLVLRAEIGERLLAKVVPGMEAVVRFPAFPDRVYRARVSQVGAYPRGGNRRYPVELVWEEPPTDLRPGLTSMIEVLSQRLEAAWVVPRDVLEWRGATAYVHTGTQAIAVETGPGNAEGVVITSGLSEGMRLVRP